MRCFLLDGRRPRTESERLDRVGEMRMGLKGVLEEQHARICGESAVELSAVFMARRGKVRLPKEKSLRGRAPGRRDEGQGDEGLGGFGGVERDYMGKDFVDTVLW